MKRKRMNLAAPVASILLATLLAGCANTSGATTASGSGASGSVSASSPEAGNPGQTTQTTQTDKDSSPSSAKTDGADPKPSQPLVGTLTDLANRIYSDISGVQFPTLVSREISLTDKESFKWVFGIEPPAGAVAALASEPMAGSIPYTMALLQLEEGADMAAVAASIKAGVDPHKWICVWAETVETAYHGDVILLIMDKDVNRAKAVLDAFDKAMG